MKSPRFVFLCTCCFLLVALLSGCDFFFGPRLPALEDYYPVSAERKKHLLEVLRRQAEPIHSARAQFSAEIKKGLVSRTLEQSVVFLRPSKLRVELFATSFQKLVNLIIVHDGLLEMLDPNERVLYRGASDSKNIERTIRVPFSADELMLWFTGNLALPASDETQISVLENSRNHRFAIQYTRDDGRFLRALVRVVGEEPLKKLDLLSVELRTLETAELAFFSEFHDNSVGLSEGSNSLVKEDSASSSVPAPRISFWLPAQEVRGELTYEKLQLNPNLQAYEERLFQLKVPEGVRIEDLDHDTFIRRPIEREDLPES